MPMISISLPEGSRLVAEPLDPIPLSALQHGAYCPRRCGLIHLEQAFDDKLRGNAVHAHQSPDVPQRVGLEGQAWSRPAARGRR